MANNELAEETSTRLMCFGEEVVITDPANQTLRLTELMQHFELDLKLKEVHLIINAPDTVKDRVKDGIVKFKVSKTDPNTPVFRIDIHRGLVELEVEEELSVNEDELAILDCTTITAELILKDALVNNGMKLN